MDSPACVVCGKQLAMRFYLCHACHAEHGWSMKEYPPWLQFLVRDEAKERMRILRGYYNREIPLDDVDSDAFWYVEYWDEDRFFRR